MIKARTAMVAVLASLAVCCAAAATASAGSPVYSFDTIPTTTQAGGHPDIEVGFEVGTRASAGYSDPCFCNDAKEIRVHLPAGVIGNPHVTPQCTATEFANTECPVDSQVGAVATLIYSRIPDGGQYQFEPLYNMVPHQGQAGLTAFPAPYSEVPIFTVLSARTGGDYGLDAITSGIQRIIPIYGVHQFLWGVPADPIHDELRFPQLGHGGEWIACGFNDILPRMKEGRSPQDICLGNTITPRPSNSPRLPFMSNPTTCAGPLPSFLDSISYDHGFDTGATLYPGMTGCDLLSFNPSQSALPTTTEADAPSGLDVDLKVPQLQSPSSPTPSQIRSATLTLPEGFTINANAADGKVACTDAEASFGTKEAAHCPDFSKIGTLSIDSSALPGPISGFVYLGEPQPGDRYRLILAADGYATHIKIAGSIFPDPDTGRVVTTFPELPQSPLTEFRLHMFGSERGVLATPTQCGRYSVHSTFVPWDGELSEQSSTQFFTIDSGPGGAPCPTEPRAFNPRLEAASHGNTAGAFSPFTVTINRDDGDQDLAGLEVKTPPGFSASLRGIPYCPDATIAQLSAGGYTGLGELASSACPAASRIGTVAAGVGAGSRPLTVDGKVFLAGPYKGAPLSLMLSIPAVSGPYDLGNVVTRAAIHVDPVTAQVRTVSDPFPQISGGIPFRTRSLQVNLDRPDFTLNPTDCDPLHMEAELSGDEGGRARFSPYYQVANCATLPFAPNLRMVLSGGLERRGHPAIHAVFTSSPGQANSRRVTVTLPKGELLDNNHINTVCTRVEYAAGTCPPGAVIGEAEAVSPLLDKPLRGQVYLRSSSNRLPDLVVGLHGQIDVEASARIDSVKGRLRTSFESLPDVPISKFTLDLMGGRKGLLQNSEGLCGRSQRAMLDMVGHNGDRRATRVKLVNGCKTPKRHKRHARTKRGA